MGRLGLDLAVGVLWSPQRAYGRIGEPGALGLCVLLFLGRWLVTPLTTVRNLLTFQSPVLLPLPFGGDVATYRYWEQFWYAPYGIAAMLAIIAAVTHQARRQALPARFGDVFRLVAVAYFAPWTFTAAADCVIIPAGWLMPYAMAGLHVAALGWSTLLLAAGLAERYALAPLAALRLAGLAAGVFAVFGAAVMR
jgi:hypothetical protein